MYMYMYKDDSTHTFPGFPAFPNTAKAPKLRPRAGSHQDSAV